MKKRNLLFLAALSVVLSAAAAPGADIDAPTTRPLRVAISLISPFVVEKTQADGRKEYAGFTIEYWRAIADEMNVTFELEKETFQEVLDRTRDGRADIGAGAISITSEREANGLDFSYSFFDSGLGILTLRREGGGFFALASEALLTEGTQKVVVFLFLYILFTAHVIWLCEKGQDAFNDKYFPGVPEGAWWTIVTMSTVGYGDMVPKKWLGKFCAVVTIFVGIGVFGWALSQLTAVSVSDWKSEIESASDLSRRTVAVKRATTSKDSVLKYGARVRETDDLEEAYALLRAEKVDAVVHDWPVLSYYALNDKSNDLAISGEMFDKQDYGFVFQEGNPLKERVNRAHLKLLESGTLGELRRKYFGDASK